MAASKRSRQRPEPLDIAVATLERIRALGAESASVTVRGVELCASFPKRLRRKERQPAIGFMSNASPAEELVEED